MFGFRRREAVFGEHAVKLHALVGLLLVTLSAARSWAEPSEGPRTPQENLGNQGPPPSFVTPIAPAPAGSQENLTERLETALSGAADDLGAENAEIRVLSAGSDLFQEVAKTSPSSRWRLFATLEASDPARLIVLGVAPASNVVLLRSEMVTARELEVRAIAMTRDLVRSVEPDRTPPAQPACVPCGAALAVRSPGRATLALQAALIGGYLGYSIERAGGSNDARLTYPLMALGTGLGIGAAMVVADEWDVGYGDAWFLSAGALWPTTSALLLADGYQVTPTSSRFVVGLAGTAGGLTLASLALSRGHISDGAATLAHSGGAFGLLLGGLGEMAIAGKTGFTPTRGMGYGSAAGVLVAGAVATLGSAPAPSRVLLVDLGAGLGALTGAAATSPLAIADTNHTRKRIWLGSIAAGGIAGAIIGYLMTGTEKTSAGSATLILPFAQVIPKTGQNGKTGITIGVQGAW